MARCEIPLAIARLKVSDLPTTVVLDNTMAMRPDMNLQSAQKNEQQVELVARISRSDNAIAASGDWQVFRNRSLF